MIASIKKAYLKYRILKIFLFPLVLLRRGGKKVVLRVKYRILADLSSSLAVDPVVRVDDFCGDFEISRNSDLFFRVIINKNYEPKLSAICVKYIDPDRDIIDVGANIGFYTVLFAKSNPERKVLAIEPTQNALARLYKNIELNDVIGNVDVYKGVVSDSEGTLDIKTILGKEEYSSIGGMTHPSIKGEQWKTETVQSITLDQLIEEKSLSPGFIKVDTEGAEHLVFAGASKTLVKHRPVVLSELSDFLLQKNGTSARQVVELFEGFGYKVVDPIDPNVKPGTKNFGDILCIPEEKA